MDTMLQITGSKLIAIARGIYNEELEEATLALYRGGVRAFEVTFEQDNDIARASEKIDLTCKAIGRLCEILPEDAAVGAGTVMNADQVKAACASGAKFMISPNSDRSVIEQTKLLSLVSIPGAMTPTEIVDAYSFGADIVKVFPAGLLGAEYFKAIKAPLSHIPLAAVAGITPENIRDFALAGASVFGISSGLYKASSIKKREFEALTETAMSFYKALN